MIARWFTNPRFFMAPAGEGAADGEGGGEGAGAGEEAGDGEEGAEEEPEKPAAKEKPAPKPKPGEKPKPAEKGKAAAKPAAGEKVKPGEKGAAKPAGKTLLGGSGKPAAGAEGEGKEKGAGAGEGGEAEDLDAWKPELADGQEVDEELLGELKTVAKAKGWKGADLQELVGLGTKMQEKVGAVLVQRHEEHVESLAKQARADKEIGGAKLEGVVANGLAVLKAHTGDDYEAVIAEVERTGIGSHPAFLKFLNRIHEATKEDDTVARTGRGAGGAPARKSFADAMYPKMQKELARGRGEAVDDD
jgi:hypothetical protein